MAGKGKQEERVLIQVPVRVGEEEGRWPVPASPSWEGLLQKAPWSPGEILRWIVLEEGEEQAEAQWLALLRIYEPWVRETRAAWELTLDVAEKAFGGRGKPVAQVLFQDLSLAQQIVSLAPPDFCLLALEGCVEEDREKEARLLLQAFRQSPLAETRENWQSLVERLAVRAFEEGWTGRTLEELTGLLPWERRNALGALVRKKRETPVEWRYPHPGPTKRVGEELMRLLIQREMDGRGQNRPRFLGGLFLDLVLLRRPAGGPGEAIPLWNEEGNLLGQLPLGRLPEHQRRMIRCMMDQGEEVFALLDGELSLAGAGLWCAALYWKRKGEENRG